MSYGAESLRYRNSRASIEGRRDGALGITEVSKPVDHPGRGRTRLDVRTQHTTDGACWCQSARPSSSVAAARGWLAVVGPRIALITSCLPAITRSRVSRGGRCIVTVIRSIFRAFDDDGVLLHDEGGRVVAHARHGLRDQLPGTGIRHDLHRRDRCMPTSAVDHIASRVVEATFAAPRIARVRLSPRSASVSRSRSSAAAAARASSEARDSP